MHTKLPDAILKCQPTDDGADRGPELAEKIPGQPGQTPPQPAHRPGQDQVMTRLKWMQYRPGLLEGFLGGTGLDLTPFL